MTFGLFSSSLLPDFAPILCAQTVDPKFQDATVFNPNKFLRAKAQPQAPYPSEALSRAAACGDFREYHAVAVENVAARRRALLTLMTRFC
jgi:hypothetical protein